MPDPLEQALNGLQFGLMLFLLAAGLTLVFGVMDMINLAHGSLYMVGAFLAAWLVGLTGSFVLRACVGAVALHRASSAWLLEVALLRTLYARDHLSQVLATFALILILNDGVRMVFGNDLPLSAPAALAGPVELLPGLCLSGLPAADPRRRPGAGAALYLLVHEDAAWARWCAPAPRTARWPTAMGVDIKRALHASCSASAPALCAVAGALLGPLLAVQVGMGENILILAFVVIVIGGIGSIRGALVGSLLVGCVDTLGRTLLQQLFREFLPPQMGERRRARRSRRSRSTCSWRRCSRSGRRACSRRAADGGGSHRARRLRATRRRCGRARRARARAAAGRCDALGAGVLPQPRRPHRWSTRSPRPASTSCSATAAWCRSAMPRSSASAPMSPAC